MRFLSDILSGKGAEIRAQMENKTWQERLRSMVYLTCDRYSENDESMYKEFEDLVSQLLQEEREKDYLPNACCMGGCGNVNCGHCCPHNHLTENGSEKMKIYSDAYDKAYKIGYNGGYKIGREELKKELMEWAEDKVGENHETLLKDLLTKLND
jgi:hypothetical protein